MRKVSAGGLRWENANTAPWSIKCNYLFWSKDNWRYRQWCPLLAQSGGIDCHHLFLTKDVLLGSGSGKNCSAGRPVYWIKASIRSWFSGSGTQDWVRSDWFPSRMHSTSSFDLKWLMRIRAKIKCSKNRRNRTLLDSRKGLSQSLHSPLLNWSHTYMFIRSNFYCCFRTFCFAR